MTRSGLECFVLSTTPAKTISTLRPDSSLLTSPKTTRSCCFKRFKSPPRRAPELRYDARHMVRILVTNDDGIYSEGLRKLADACLRIDGVEVTIGAPDREQSAASHALTLNRPLRMLKLRENEYIVDGTPADCVNLAVLKLMRDHRPALVVSGINFGPNLGDDVTYSGTISAAFEGALLDVPSIAFSTLVGEGFSFDRCAGFAETLIRWALDHHRDPHIILNVNFPVEFSGVRVARLGNRIYAGDILERADPRGRTYYWIGTGTGYQAVVLSKLCAKVFSIERVNELALRAAELIRTLKIYNATVKVFDGTYGWSDQAPFDRIIVAAAAPEVPKPLLEQLSRTGKLVIPIGAEGNQRLARVMRVGTRVQIEDCGSAEFVPLVGKFGWKE